MLPTEDLFVYVYVLIDDLIVARAIGIPPRPGPVPGCSDAELLAIAVVRHLLGRRSEAGFLDEVARDWAHLFPVLPHQSEANRRIRRLWGAFEQFRTGCARCPRILPADRYFRAACPHPSPRPGCCGPTPVARSRTPRTPSGSTLPLHQTPAAASPACIVLRRNAHAKPAAPPPRTCCR